MIFINGNKLFWAGARIPGRKGTIPSIWVAFPDAGERRDRSKGCS